MEKKFYTNLFSGCWLTDAEFNHIIVDYKCNYTLVPDTAKCGIEGFKVVFEKAE